MKGFPLQDADHGGPRFWVALAVGALIMGWGIALFLEATPATEARRSFVVWLVGADLAHDLLLAPVVALVAWLLARVVPGRWWPPVAAGLVISAFVVLLAWLPLAGTAHVARNPTIQPLDYRTSTLTALTLVWAGVGLWTLGRVAWIRWSRP